MTLIVEYDYWVALWSEYAYAINIRNRRVQLDNPTVVVNLIGYSLPILTSHWSRAPRVALTK